MIKEKDCRNKFNDTGTAFKFFSVSKWFLNKQNLLNFCIIWPGNRKKINSKLKITSIRTHHHNLVLPSSSLQYTT